MGIKDKGPLELLFHGEGPVARWNGQVFGSVEGMGSASAALELAAGEDLALDLVGRLVPETAGGPTYSAPSGVSELHLSVRAIARAYNTLLLDRLVVRGPGLALSGYGAWNHPSREIAARFNLTVDDLGRLEAWTRSPLGGKAEGCGEISGTLDAPRVLAALELTDFEARGIRARSLLTETVLKPTNAMEGSRRSGWHLESGGRISGVETLRGKALSQDAIIYSMEAGMPAAHDPIQLSFQLQGPPLHFSLKGTLDPASLEGDLHAALAVTDLKPVASLLGMQAAGRLDLSGQVKGNASSGTGSASLDGTIAIEGPSDDSRTTARFGSATVGAALELDPARVLHIGDAKARGPTVQLEASGTIDLDRSAIASNGTFQLDALESLAWLIHPELFGSAAGRFELSGPLDDFKGSVSLRGRNIRWQALEVPEVRAGVEATQLPQRPRGRLDLALQRSRESLEATGAFALDVSRLALSDWRITTPGGHLEGDFTVTMDTPTPLVQGTLLGKFDNLARLGQLVGRQVEGSASVDARLTVSNGAQNGTVAVRGASLRMDKGRIGRLAFNGDIKDIHRTLQGTLRAELGDVEADRVQLKTVALRANGDGSRMSFSADARGRAGQTFELALSGLLARPGEALRVELTQGHGKVGAYPFRVLAPLVLERSPGGLSVNRSTFGIAQGKATFSGSLTESRVKAALLLEDIPLQLVSLFGGPDVAGSATARFEVDGAPAQPTADIRLSLSDLRANALKRGKERSGALEATARLERGRVQGSIELSQFLDEPARATFAIPVRLSVAGGFSATIPESEPLRADVVFKGDLGALEPYLALPDQSFSGRADGLLQLSGTWATPSYGGEVRIARGAYENLSTGSVLKDVTASLAARDRRLEIHQFTASDGARGSLRLSGSFELDLEKRFPLAIEAALNDALIVRRTDLTATVGGDLKITGSLERIALSGTLAVSPAEYDLPDRPPPGLVDLDVKHVNRPPGKSRPERDGPRPCRSDSRPAGAQTPLSQQGVCARPGT